VLGDDFAAFGLDPELIAVADRPGPGVFVDRSPGRLEAGGETDQVTLRVELALVRSR